MASPQFKLTKNMKNSTLFLFLFLFLFVLTLSFCVSFTVSSSILDVTPDSKDILACLQSFSISEFVYTSNNASFLPIWQAGVQNTRFLKPSTRKPSVIVTPVNETQIQMALYCTKKHGYQIRIRSGGHDFEGLSYTAEVPFVMIDFTNMRSINVDVKNRVAWVQGGASVGELFYSISRKTNRLYFPGSQWPTVGISGYIGGGGYGSLLRKYGTGADNLLDVRFVDVNGNIFDRMSMGEDLFWAIRGGVSSSFGIVIEWKVKLVPVPEKVTVFRLNKSLEEGATEIFHKYQYVAPSIDRNLLIRTRVFNEYIGNTTMKTVRIIFDGIYQGTSDTLVSLLDIKFPELGVTQTICEEMTSVQSTLVFWGFPISTPSETLTNRSAFPKLNHKSNSDYIRTPIPIAGLRKIWRKIMETDQLFTILYMNPFGGRIAEFSETAIPYPHRAGVLLQILKIVDLENQTSDTRIEWLRSFDSLLTPYVSKNPREAYVNYNDLDFGVGNATYEEASVWGERYWKRHNFKRLIRIKAKVDPMNFFRHPQSIPVFSERMY